MVSKCGETLFCALVKSVESHGGKQRSQYTVKTEVVDAEEIWKQQRSEKTAMKRTTMSKARSSFSPSMQCRPSLVRKPLRGEAALEKKKSL